MEQDAICQGISPFRTAFPHITVVLFQKYEEGVVYVEENTFWN